MEEKEETRLIKAIHRLEASYGKRRKTNRRKFTIARRLFAVADRLGLKPAETGAFADLIRTKYVRKPHASARG